MDRREPLLPSENDIRGKADREALRRRRQLAAELGQFSERGRDMLAQSQRAAHAISEMDMRMLEQDRTEAYRRDALEQARALKEAEMRDTREWRERESAQRAANAQDRQRLQQMLLERGYIPGVGFVPGLAPPAPAPVLPGGSGGGAGLMPAHTPSKGTPAELPAVPKPLTGKGKLEDMNPRLQLPTDVRKSLDELDDVVATIGETQRLINSRPKAFGWGSAMGDWVPGPVGGRLLGSLENKRRDPEDTKVRTVVFQYAQDIVHKLAGASQSAQEISAIRAFAPDPNDSAETLLAKLEGAFGVASARQRRLYGTYLPDAAPPGAAAPMAAPPAPAPAAGPEPSVEDLIKKYR
jgi:hypothetical protein